MTLGVLGGRPPVARPGSVVRCRCVCGGELVAPNILEEKRDEAIRHSVTPEHRAWRARQ